MPINKMLDGCVVAISISESPDMDFLGFTDDHLRDAMTEIARHLVALGAKLVYGGDLRAQGFSELLFGIVTSYCYEKITDEERDIVTNYFAWPVHASFTPGKFEQISKALAGIAKLICLNKNGEPLAEEEIHSTHGKPLTDSDWCSGLTAMRRTMLAETDARIVLGGRTEKYKGRMPGIAEEALLSLQNEQPLYLIGGYGGCTGDIAENLNLIPQTTANPRKWKSRRVFDKFTGGCLNNGLVSEENKTLASTPYIDQAIALIIRGLLKVNSHRETLSV